MTTVTAAMEGLDDAARVRVLEWAVSRFAPEGVNRQFGRSAQPTANESRRGTGEGEALSPDDFEDVASLFDAANPTTDADKALVVAYWLQTSQGTDTVDGFSVNKELKNLGHGVSNITDAFNTLMNRKPRHAIQVRKSGTTKQARKKYKVTGEGMKQVRNLVQGLPGDGS
jgi:hypothetical protein